MTILLDPVVQRRMRSFFGDGHTQYIATTPSALELALGEIYKLQAKIQYLEAENDRLKAELIVSKCVGKVKQHTPEITFTSLKRKIQA
jgi:uncharacterized small protein (DUF1192 family)